jgi:advillin
VNGLRDKVKNALDPEVERKRRREEREERQRARDEKERERERIEREKAESETQTTKDVFGDIKNVTEPESAEKEVVSEEDEDENLINGQEVKIDPNQERESSYEEEDSQVEMEEEEEDLESEEEEEEPLKFERPKSNGKPVEIVILDSDEEEEQREKDRKSSLEREDSVEEDYSGVDEDELEASGAEDEDSQFVASCSSSCVVRSDLTFLVSQICFLTFSYAKLTPPTITS